MRIEERIEKKGRFWVCGREDEKVSGILTIEEGGRIELEVFELLGGFDSHYFDRIGGVIEGGGYVTLIRSFYKYKAIPLGAVSSSIIHVHKALLGVYLEEDDDEEVNFFSFATDCLDEWVGVGGTQVENFKHGVVVRYEQPEKIVYKLNNGMDLEVRFEYSLPGAGSLTRSVVEQRAVFCLCSSEYFKIDDFIEIASRLVNFLGFAIDDTVSIKKVRVSSGKIYRENGEEKFPVPISVYYESIPYSERVPKKHWRQMLFCYREIESNAGDIINNWMSSYEALAPSFRLYFTTKTGGQKYLEGKFLALVQGLETYHRRTSDEKEMGREKYKAMIESVFSSCPDEYVPWLKRKLSHGNEISLRTRIDLIMSPFEKYFGSYEERKGLVSMIVATRNYLTHYNEGIKGRARGAKDLAEACRKMEAIFQLHFLRMIGLTCEEVDMVVNNNISLKDKIVRDVSKD